MQKAQVTSLKFLLLSILFLNVFSANADHQDIYGAEIYYEHLTDDIVLITVTAYNTCKPKNLYPDSAVIKIKPINSAAFKAKLTYLGYTDASPVVAGQCTPCSYSGCVFNIGQKKHTWQAKIDLKNYTDCEFKFIFNDYHRDEQFDTLRVEAKMNRCINGYVNSPKFLFDQTTFYVQNQCATRFQSAIAGKNDSLVYKLVPPKYSATVNWTYPESYSYTKPVKYSGFPGTYNFSYSSCSGFTLNEETGELKFQPTEADQRSSVAIMVEQYQKDSTGKMVKVAEITRDMTLWILGNSGNKPPIIVSTKGRNIFACAGTDLNYTFNTNDYDQQDIVNTSAVFEINGATFSNTSHLRLNRGTIKWKPELKDTSTKPYRVYITASDNKGPLSSVTQEVFNIFVVKPPKIKLNITKNTCASYQLAAEEDTVDIVAYKWIVNDIVFSTEKKPIFQAQENGKYIIRLEATTKGCTILAQDSIEINFLKTFKIANDTNICHGNAASLNPAPSYDYFYFWQGGKLADSSAANPIVSPDSTTIYTVKAIDKIHGCEYFDTVNVNVSNLSIRAGNDTLTCAMQAITLNVAGPKDASYIWMTDGKIIDSSASVNIITPAKTSVYKVIARNKLGCENADSVTVNITQSQANAGEDKMVCFGDSIQLNGTGGYNYYWTDTSGNILRTEASFYIKPDNNTTYILYTTDSLRCKTSTDTVVVNVANTGVKTMPDTIICAGDVIEIWASGGNAYNWLPENTLSGNKLTKPTVFPSQNTTYYVQVSDTNLGCTVTRSVTVSVDDDCVWPGDANKDKFVNFKDVLYLGVGYNSAGKMRVNASNDWKPQHTINWAEALQTGTNYKHFDTDGNGKIDFNDLSVIQANYFHSHDYTPVPYIEPFSGISLYVDLGKDTFYAGDTVKARFILGESINYPNNIYGAGFQYQINGNAVLETSQQVNFDNNYFTDANSGKLTNYKLDGFVGEMSVVRTNHENTAGFGEVSALQFVLKDTLYNYAPQGEKLLLKPTDVLVIDKLGNPINVVLKGDSAIVYKKRKVYVPEPVIVPDFKIYPVPTKSSITIESTIDLNTDIYFTDALGKIIGKETAVNEKVKTIDLIMLRAGVYFVHFNFENKRITRKIIICK